MGDKKNEQVLPFLESSINKTILGTILCSTFLLQDISAIVVVLVFYKAVNKKEADSQIFFVLNN